MKNMEFMDMIHIKPIVISDICNNILDDIDKGVKTDEIRQNLSKYVLVNGTKEIIINKGGRGIFLCREIVTEMARRGDPFAFEKIYKNNFSSHIDRQGYIHECVHLLNNKRLDDRENKILIEIIKEGQLLNIQHMALEVYVVPERNFDYSIYLDTSNPLFVSEKIHGYISFVARLESEHATECVHTK